MGRYLIPGALFAILVVFLYMGLYGRPDIIPSPFIGKPAPAFSVPDVRDGARTVSNADYAGRMYLLNVWGTWCAACRDEHGTLLAIANSKAIPIIGLNWNDDRKRALRYLDNFGNPYDAVPYDPQGKVVIDWGVYGAPETFLVSAEGRVLHKHFGALTWPIWERDFLPRIRAERPSQDTIQ